MNRPYNMFQNTLRDMDECVDNLDEELHYTAETIARKRMIQLCVQVDIDYGHVVGREVEEVGE